MSDEEKSSIYIEFENIGMATPIKYNPQNVTPFQLLAMAHFLEFEGKNNLAMVRGAQIRQQMEQEQRSKIITPDIGQVLKK